MHAKRRYTKSAYLERYRQFWEGSFERLDEVLEELKADEQRRLTDL